MSELKYNQIVDKLNTEFASEGRRLVFWYDDNGYLPMMWMLCRCKMQKSGI